MADIVLHRDQCVNRTVVPNSFIDGYMVSANGEYVKVYLYLLRCLVDPAVTFSITECADKFDNTEKDVIRALKYWEKKHLIRLDFDADKEICAIYLSGADPVISAFQPTNLVAEANVSTQTNEVSALALDNNSPDKTSDIGQVVFIVESYVNRPLSPSDTDTLIYWMDELGFDNDLIDYLVESCVSNGHTNFSYINKVAIEWAKAGITTAEEAMAENARHSNLYTSIKKALGISGRAISTKEEEYISTWTSEYGFNTEIIIEACNRTIQNIHTPDFRYANSILSNWKKNGANTIDDISRLDEAHTKSSATATQAPKASTNKGANFTERQYDPHKLERDLFKNASIQ